MQADTQITFIGGGNMARSLIGALLRQGRPADMITVAEPAAALRTQLAADFGVTVHADNATAAAAADVLVIAVKPQIMAQVCAQLASAFAGRTPLCISIAAGIRLQQLGDWLGEQIPVVRSMPNTPALIGAGATGLIASSNTDAAQRAIAETILGAAGMTVWIEDEALMDTVTALSGSGPAYFFLLVEAMEKAAVAQGLPQESARALAVQTCLGAGRMLAEGNEPASILRERVTSPGGTTQAALDTFMAGDFAGLVDRAMQAAARRGRELSDAMS